MYKNPESLIRENIEFQCPICCEVFNESERFPMMICPLQHSCCLDCLHNKLFKNKKADEQINCPFCKSKIYKASAQKFRMLNQIRITARQLRVEGSTIKKDIKHLSEKNADLINELNKEKEKNEWLIQQFHQKQQTVSERFEKRIQQIFALVKRQVEDQNKEASNNTKKLEQKLYHMEFELKSKDKEIVQLRASLSKYKGSSQQKALNEKPKEQSISKNVYVEKKLSTQIKHEDINLIKPTQEKFMQVKKQFFSEVSEGVKRIPPEEKKKITSLTLKITGIISQMQLYISIDPAQGFYYQVVIVLQQSMQISLKKVYRNVSIIAVSISLSRMQEFNYKAYQMSYRKHVSFILSKTYFLGLSRGYDFIHKAYSFDDQSSTNLFTKRINKFTSAVIEPSIRVYLALDSCKDDINKDEITDMLKFFTSLRHFAIYMRYKLADSECFHKLRETLNKMQLTKIEVVIDPAFQKSMDIDNWGDVWLKEKNPNKIIRYQKWDWDF